MWIRIHSECKIEYISRNFDVLSVENILKINPVEKNIDRDKPYCIITFDDGWSDFYHHAYPVLKYFNASATVFLPTEFIGTTQWFWTDKLAYMLENILNGDISEADKKMALFSIGNYADLHAPFDTIIDHKIAEMKFFPMEQINTMLKDIGARWDIDTERSEKSFITWEQAREMHASGMVSFGSHTSTHKILTTCTEEEIRRELTDSKKMLLENNVVRSFIPFAYPNGNYTDAIANIVKETGYNLAVTTEKGWNMISGIETDKFTIRRVGLHQDVSSTKHMLACRIHGIY